MAYAEGGKFSQQAKGMPSRGAEVMALADMLRGPVRAWLATCRMDDGRPVPPEQAYGVAFELAQDIARQRADNKPH